MKVAIIITTASIVFLSAPLVGSPTETVIQTEQAKLLASDGRERDYFGHSVSIDGNTVVVGVPFGDHGGWSSEGSAYVFIRSAGLWNEEAKLLPSAESDVVNCVSIDGDTAVVGTHARPDAYWSGDVYVFVRSGAGWAEQARLVPSDAVNGDSFGCPLAIDGNTVVVGATGHADDDWWDEEMPGAAYVFARNGEEWTEQAKLLPSDGARPGFGSGVSIDGDTVLVGGPLNSDYVPFTGAVYVFERYGEVWIEQAKLIPRVPIPAGMKYTFGSSTSIDGDTALIGARRLDNEYHFSSGAAHVFFRRDGRWREQAQLLPADIEPEDAFGSRVSLDGNLAVIGAQNSDDYGDGSGSAYVFLRRGEVWTEQTKLLASDGAEGDWFGESVSIDKGTIVIGASYDDDNGNLSGSAYIFSVGTIFADGFESGDCSNWSEEVPEP